MWLRGDGLWAWVACGAPLAAGRLLALCIVCSAGKGMTTEPASNGRPLLTAVCARQAPHAQRHRLHHPHIRQGQRYECNEAAGGLRAAHLACLSFPVLL